MPTIIKLRCSTVAGLSGRPIPGSTPRSTIGRMWIKAAPRKLPRRLPSPPMITMNKMVKERSIPNTDDSALPYQRNTSIAPATPQT